MPKRVKDGGTNTATLAGKVNAGQFAGVQNQESQNRLATAVVPAVMNPGLEARLAKIQQQVHYSNQVYSHFALNAMAADVKSALPTAKTMVFDIEDPELPYLEHVILEDGTKAVHEFSSETEDEIYAVTWSDSYYYSAFGNDSRGLANIDVDAAVDMPAFLTDDTYLDAPKVPTSTDVDSTIPYVHTLAELDFTERSVRFHQEGETFAERQMKRIQVRRAELEAAGVTR